MRNMSNSTTYRQEGQEMRVEHLHQIFLWDATPNDIGEAILDAAMFYGVDVVEGPPIESALRRFSGHKVGDLANVSVTIFDMGPTMGTILDQAGDMNGADGVGA